MLTPLELQQHVLVIVMVKVYTMALHIHRSLLRLLTQFLHILHVGSTFRNGLHFMLPVVVEPEVLVEAQVRHSPAACAAALCPLQRVRRVRTS